MRSSFVIRGDRPESTLSFSIITRVKTRSFTSLKGRWKDESIKFTQFSGLLFLPHFKLPLHGFNSPLVLDHFVPVHIPRTLVPFERALLESSEADRFVSHLYLARKQYRLVCERPNKGNKAIERKVISSYQVAPEPGL
jgi:hypothetical protein